MFQLQLFFLLHCDEWDRVVALPRHKFVTGATLLQLIDYISHPTTGRLSGQQMLSGTQIISTSHGMTGKNFFDVFLPFYLLFGF